MTGPSAPPAARERSVPRERVVLCGLAMLSVLAAVIHFAVAGSHFQDYWLFGVFLLAGAGAAALAALLSVALVDGGPEMVMTAGAASAGAQPAAGMNGMNSATASGAPVHLATRSPAGYITGPDPGTPGSCPSPTAVDATDAQVVRAAGRVAAPRNGTA